ncbi:MAG: hypothetical protein SGPRY_014120, partial [Prymnesium sp.]
DASDGSALPTEQLELMGFSKERVAAAWAAAGGGGLEAALQWLFDNPDLAPPASSPSASTAIQAMGFPVSVAREAVAAVGADTERAVQWILSRPASEQEPSSSEPPMKQPRFEEEEPQIYAPLPSVAVPSAPCAAPPLPASLHDSQRSPTPPSSVAATPSLQEETALPAKPAPVAPLQTSQAHSASRSAPISLKRLMRELRLLRELDRFEGGCRCLHQFDAGPVSETNLYVWEVHLYDFAEEQLAADMAMRKVSISSLSGRIPSRAPHLLQPNVSFIV